VRVRERAEDRTRHARIRHPHVPHQRQRRALLRRDAPPVVRHQVHLNQLCARRDCSAVSPGMAADLLGVFGMVDLPSL